MADPVQKLEERFTYGDYLGWPEDERWELIDGVAYSMSPAPGATHQTLVGRLFFAAYKFLEGKPCRAYVAPFDVLFPRGDEEDRKVDSVVQPDILVVCDSGKVAERGVRGAPDLAIEVLSPWTMKKDLGPKWQLYEKRGVREYWVVDPGNRAVQAWRLQPDGRYDAGKVYTGDGLVESDVIPGFSMELRTLFAPRQGASNPE